VVEHRIMVVGQSHVRALLDGFDLLARSGTDLPEGTEASFVTSRPDNLVVTTWHPDGTQRRQPKISLAELAAQIDPGRIVLAWGGNQMNVRALVATGRPFDFLLPGSEAAPRPDPAVELIPCAVIDSYVRQRLEANETLRPLLDEAAGRGTPVSVLGPPPPLPEEAVRQRLSDSPHFVGVMEKLRTSASEVPIVPDPVRERLWTLMTGAYRTFAEHHGLDFLEPPATTIDGQGMLGSPYWGADATHANAEYGALVMDTVVRTMLETLR
jgi:hypothetical protein